MESYCLKELFLDRSIALDLALQLHSTDTKDVLIKDFGSVKIHLGLEKRLNIRTPRDMLTAS